MLHVENITFRIGGRTLFDGASAHIPAGHRVGFVGANGTGKTTLLNLITGRSELDGGAIRVRSKAKVGMVAQVAPDGEQTPLQATLAADRERALLLAEADSATDPERIAEVHTRLAEIAAHAAPARAASILAGLGFSEEAQHRPLRSFSGGLKMRVALAAVLFYEPDLLLLDEPTNHLDVEAAFWLENHLRAYPHTLLVASHDRGLLADGVDSILHLEDGKLEVYTGGFDTFERIRLARMEQNQALSAKQDADRKRIQAFIDRFKAKATKARQAKSRAKTLDRMVTIPTSTPHRKFSFSFPPPKPLGSPIIRLDSVSAGYVKKQPILSDLHLSVLKDDRIALLGANGNGKTTLARVLAGEIAPEEGQLVKSSKLKVGYFAQDHLEKLDPRLTAIEQMHLEMPDASLGAVRSWLGRFSLGENKAEVKVPHLSGGEKTRLALAVMAKREPNLMILDEPTNHLDLDSRSALIQALMEYTGAVILISHDRHLIEATADQLWLVADGTAKMFFGDLDEYRSLLFEARKNERAALKGNKEPKATAKEERKLSRKRAADKRARLAPLKKEAEEAEARLEELLEKIDEINRELADPETYTGNPERIAELGGQQKRLEQEVEAAELRWEEAETALEAALADQDSDDETDTESP